MRPSSSTNRPSSTQRNASRATRGSPVNQTSVPRNAFKGSTLCSESLAGYFSFDAFDVPVDRIDLLVAERLASWHARRGVIAPDRPAEGMELAGHDLGLLRRDLLQHRRRHDRADADEVVHPLLHAPPDVLLERLAGEVGLGDERVVGGPDLYGRAKVRLRRVRGHVGVPAE